MSKPWMESVRKTGELAVFNKSVIGKWSPVFKSALESFNKLNTRYNLGVEMITAKDEAEANIVMHISNGIAKFTYGDTTETRSFDGKRFHGKTLGFGTENEIRKAAIFLPSEPQSQAGFSRGKMIYEKANQDMMRVIAVHELVHACCLDSNLDHSKKEGIFVDQLTPIAGKLVPYWSGGNGKAVPPMFLAPETVGAIQSNWK